MFVVYPYLKRVTWLCHVWLGACLGLAPVGAWLAVTGSAPWEAWAVGVAVGALGRRLRPLLLALRPRPRSRRGPPLVGGSLRRAGACSAPRVLPILAPSLLLAAAGAGLDVGLCVLARRRRDGGTARLRALDRPPGRSAAAGRCVLHAERRHQRRLLRLRRRGRARSDDPWPRHREAVRPQACASRRGHLRSAGRVRGRHRAERKRQDDAAAAARRAGAPDARRSRSSTSIGLASGTSRTSRSSIASSPPPRTSTSSAGSTGSPSGASGSACCSSGSRSGTLRNERVSTYSRGMLQRLALCRVAAPRSRPARARRAVLGARRGRRRRFSTASSRRSPGRKTVVVSTHDPARLASLRSGTLALA